MAFCWVLLLLQERIFTNKDGHFELLVSTSYKNRTWLRSREDGDLYAEVVTDLEDDFTAESEQSVFMGKDKFFDFAATAG